ncbi:hypothetical protein [Pseudonocardia sp.]|uniref:hypothetical protein n=1 Tax=Pseudonocardia sp. TaxID=60912 RepID=UPI003D096064
MCDGARYEFLVPGELTAAAAGAFPELTVTPGPVGGTILFGYVRDQAHLQGLLERFAELAIAVVEMRRLPD